MYILTVGLNHKTAPVEIREKISFGPEDLPEAFRKLRSRPHVEGCVILSTCNRTEVYIAATDVEAGLNNVYDFLARSFNLPMQEMRNYFYNHTLYDAVRHLFRVAAGLDSMILGETQILGQVRDAYQLACEYNGTNSILNTLFQQAITVGKKVRTDTQIDRSAVSISYAAVELAKKSFEKLTGRSVLIVGAGKMSKLTVSYLKENGVSTVFVANRSREKSLQLAGEMGGQALSLEEMPAYLGKVDIVISCTAANHLVISEQHVREAIKMNSGRRLFLVDIAVPRDVEPEAARIPGVELYDIDDLQHVVDTNLEERKKAAVQAETIIDQEIHNFFQWLASLFVVPTIVALKEKANAIKDAELERAFQRLGALDEREKKVLSSLASSIVNQLLHEPIVNLKKYAGSHQGHLYAEILQNLFDLEVEGERPKHRTSEDRPQHPMQEAMAQISRQDPDPHTLMNKL